MSPDLTEEQQLILDSARAFAAEYLEPIAAALDQSGTFPKPVVEQLAAQDFLGLLLPAAFDGADAGFISYIHVIEALAGSCAAVASILNVHTLAAQAIALFGSQAQKERYLPGLAKGEQIGALAVYETGPTPGIGQEALRARRTDRGFVLNGMKAFVRNAQAAGVYVVFAAGDANAFIVPAGTPGLSIGPALPTMGLRGCPVAHVSFHDVAVAADAELAGGSSVAADLLAIGSLAEAAQTIAIGRTAVRHAADYAKHRVQFGHPISTLQAVQTLLADVTVDTDLAWLAVQHAARLIEEQKPFQTEAAVVKAFLARRGSKMVIDCCQVEGGFGYSETMLLPRLFRDIAGTTLLDAPGDFPDGLIAESIIS